MPHVQPTLPSAPAIYTTLSGAEIYCDSVALRRGRLTGTPSSLVIGFSGISAFCTVFRILVLLRGDEFFFYMRRGIVEGVMSRNR